MADTPAPTNEQVRAVLAQFVAYARQWAAQNGEVAGLYVQSEEASLARQMAAAETKAAHLIEKLAVSLDTPDRVCLGADERFNRGRVSLFPGRHPLVATLGQLAAGEAQVDVAYDFDLSEAQVSVLARLLEDVRDVLDVRDRHSDTTTGRTHQK